MDQFCWKKLYGQVSARTLEKRSIWSRSISSDKKVAKVSQASTKSHDIGSFFKRLFWTQVWTQLLTVFQNYFCTGIMGKRENDMGCYEFIPKGRSDFRIVFLKQGCNFNYRKNNCHHKKCSRYFMIPRSTSLILLRNVPTVSYIEQWEGSWEGSNKNLLVTRLQFLLLNINRTIYTRTRFYEK